MSFRVYLITPDASPATIARVPALVRAAPGGAVAVQVRDKGASREELAHAAATLVREGLTVFVSGSIEAAAQSGAAGVHLPERGPRPTEVPEGLRIGVSRHDAEGLAAAARAGADFATLSPVGPVPSKNPPLGVRGFGELAREAALPVYALGGVQPGDVDALRAAGAAGVAVIRAVFEAHDPASALRALCR